MADYVSDPSELVRRLNRYAYGPDVDPELAEKLQTIPGVAADLITHGAEFLYSYRDKLDAEGLAVMAQLFEYADQQGWESFNRNGRSRRIVQAVDYNLGERRTKPAGEEPAPETDRRDGFDWRSPEQRPQLDLPEVASVSPAAPVGDDS